MLSQNQYMCSCFLLPLIMGECLYALKFFGTSEHPKNNFNWILLVERQLEAEYGIILVFHYCSFGFSY